MTDHLGGLANGAGPGGTGRHWGEVGSTSSQGDRDITCRHIGDKHSDEEWADATGTPLEEGLELIVQGSDAPHSCADQDADRISVLRRDAEPRVVERLPCGAEGQMDKGIVSADLFAVLEVGRGVKSLYLSGEADLLIRGVE
jgi:hypothetical protein